MIACSPKNVNMIGQRKTSVRLFGSPTYDLYG